MYPFLSKKRTTLQTYKKFLKCKLLEIFFFRLRVKKRVLLNNRKYI